MEQERFKNFDVYNFESNGKWMEYVGVLDPSVPKQRINKLKMNWYRDNIDDKFSPEAYIALHQTNCSHSQKQNPQQSNPPQAKNYKELGSSFKYNLKKGILQKGLYDAENILKFGFIVSVLLHMRATNILGYSVCLLAIYRQLKRPRWDKLYAHKLFTNEFTHNIFYLSIFLFFENFQLLFYYFPLLIHFWIGISEYLKLQGGWLYNKTRKYVDAAREMKSDMMKWKHLMEILLFPVSLIMIFIGMSNIYFIMFYSSFLRIKYVLNDNFKLQFGYLDLKYVEPLKRKSPTPISYLISKVQQFCQYMVKIK